MSSKRIRKKRRKAALKCVLCGKFLSQDHVDFVAGKGGYVCHRCLETARAIAKSHQTTPGQTSVSTEIITPDEMIAGLNRIAAGQETAKKILALAFWKQQLRAQGIPAPNNHLLLYGPTGCGKTFLASQAARLAGLPHCIFDATSLSETGYKGRDAKDILHDYREAAKDHPCKQYGIIILDEIDKLAAHGNESRQAYNRGTQHTLLKLLEGDGHQNLLFILCGAFHGIGGARKQQAVIGFDRVAETKPLTITAQDFVTFGMERELMGRVPILANIDPLTEDDLVEILLYKEHSVYPQYKALFARRDVTLILPEDTARSMARKALSLGTGARALNAILDQTMEPLLFQLAKGTLRGKVEIHG